MIIAIKVCKRHKRATFIESNSWNKLPHPIMIIISESLQDNSKIFNFTECDICATEK